MREHAENDEECWCKKKYPVNFKGAQVGIATPLETGDFSIVFDNTDIAREAQTQISAGMMPASMTIREW